jgi:hypothetical protein
VKAVSTAASGVRHLSGVGLQALIILGIVAALLLAMSPLFKPAADLAGISGAAARGDAHITVPDGVFAGTTTATLNPGGSTYAYARCYQDGTLVYAQYVRSTSSNTATFTLGPTPLWQGGAANCTAEEGSFARNGHWRAVAKTTFNVSG